ncbi:3-phosphoinositide dependent protein kinase-1 [Coemansia erecta]|nr:3-phosphoinositide dependent protein kinase-1 [Coemansia erecta]
MERTLHRDLKPENILLGSDMHILITDFGTAKMFSKDDTEQRANSFVGTAEYVSPELLTDKSADCNSDLWAVGCIAFQLLTGRPPFKGLNEYQTFQKILKLDYAFPPGMSPLARDLVERILVLEPEKRLGALQRGGFRELRRHPFFEGFDWQGLSSRAPPPMVSGGLMESAAGSAANSRAMPPVVPPKPPMLRQPNNTVVETGDVSPGDLYDTRQSSSDGFSTEKTSDSFPTSPSASTDPLASAGLPPNLHNYRINLPISPMQTPVHLSYAPPPPPPPPPPPHLQQQQQQQQQHSAVSSYSSAATSHMRNPLAGHPISSASYQQLGSHSNEADIYNVRLNDHVPMPLKAEEMAVVNHQYPGTSTTNDYYSTASYRPAGQHMQFGGHLQQPVYNNNYASNSSSRKTSWAETFRAIVCCGTSSQR